MVKRNSNILQDINFMYQATLGVSSWDDTMVCTSGCRYS